MKKLLLSLAVVGAFLGMNAQKYEDITPAKFDFATYEVGPLTDFWDLCIDHQNHGAAMDKVVALGNKVTDAGYAVIYGPANAYNGNTYTSIVNVEGVGNVLQFGNTNQNGLFGGCYFIPCAEQQLGTMRVTMILRGVDGGCGYNKNTGANIAIGAVDLAKNNPNLDAISYANFQGAGNDNKWYKVVFEYAPTYAVRINFAQFLWADYIQIAYLQFERVSAQPEGWSPEQKLYGPADYSELVPEKPVEETHTVALAGAFNGWKPELNTVGDLVDNCGTIVVDSWVAGGFKILVDGEWYSNGAQYTSKGEWVTIEGNAEGNMTLPATATGQQVTFTIAADTHSFMAEWEDAATEVHTVAVAGQINGWNENANITSDIVDNCGVIVFDSWTNGEQGFKVLVDGNWLGNGNTDIKSGAWQSVGGGGNMKLDASAEGKKVTFTIALDYNFKAEWESGEPTPDPEYTELYLRGNFNNWEAQSEYKFRTDDGNIYILDNITIPKAEEWGTNFKVATASWEGEYVLGALPDQDSTVTPGIPFNLYNGKDSQNLYLPEAYTGYVVVNLEIMTLGLVQDLSGIDGVAVEAPAFTVNGRNVMFNGNAQVFTVSGAQVANGSAATLAPGLYIANVEGKAVKFVVK